MKYYLHDTNSFNDEKITMLFMEYGYEGLGLFYTLLEKIGLQEKPVRTDVLKKQLHVGKKLEKCWSFMEEIGIISSNNGETFNERILSYSETYQIKKEKTREKVAQWRENQQVKKDVTSYVPVSNPSKVKESKVNKSKVNNTVGECEVLINIPFSEFWDLYDKKTGDKEKLEKKWNKLTDKERAQAMNHTVLYKAAEPDKKYRKNPETYLNNKSFNDEIIPAKNGSNVNWGNTNTGGSGSQSKETISNSGFGRL